MKRRKGSSIYVQILLCFAIIFIVSCKKTDHQILISYGNGISDNDGNSYSTVIIGKQEWMTQNLRTTKYNDDSSISLTKNNSIWTNLNSPSYCWYNNDSTSKYTYGALYNWYAVSTSKLCPKGWRVPTIDDWNILTNYLGGASIAGGKLKSLVGWDYNGNGSDDYGFNALPAGQRLANGDFIAIGKYTYWWSSSETADLSPIGMWIPFGDNALAGDKLEGGDKRQGLAIRCVRDIE